MKKKKIAKWASMGLLGGMLLTSGWFVGKTARFSYKINKSEKKWWSENIPASYKRSQGNHPTEMKAINTGVKDNNQDLYLYTPSFKSRFLFDLSYELNKVFGTEFIWGFERLTKDKSLDKDPAYSPDGKFIVFSSDRAGSFDLWMMDGQGKNLTQITKDSGDEARPKWLDNKTLMYHASKDGKSYYVTLDSESLKVLEQKVIDRGAFVGDRAFNFTLKDLAGEQYTLDDYLGKVVVLNFWSMYCGPCRVEIPSLNEFYKNKHENVEVFSLVGSYDKKDKLEEFVKKYEVNYPVLHDEEGKVGDEYQISSIPVTIIIDKQGKILARHVGSMDFTDKKFNEDIEKLVK